MVRWVAVVLVLLLLAYFLREYVTSRNRPVRAVPDATTTEAPAAAPEEAPEEAIAREERRRRSYELERELMAELEEQDADASREGFVRNEAGEPVEDASVDFGQRTMLTDSDGRFSFDWEEEDESLTFRIRHRDYLDEQFERKRDDEELVFVLDAGKSIRGVLVYPGGEPLPGERIHAYCESTGESADVETDAKGRFEFRGFPAAECQLASLVVRESVTVKGGAENVRLIALVSRVEVSLVGLEVVDFGELRVITRNLATGARSEPKEHPLRFRFTPREGIECKVMASARGHRPETVVIPPFDGKLRYEEVRIRLRRSAGAAVRLEVRKADGTRAETYRVGLVDRDGDLVRVETRSSGISYSDYVFELGSLEPGPNRIRVWQDSNAELARELTVDAKTGPNEVRRVALPDGARIRITGAPQGVSVRADPGGRYIRVRRDGSDWITASKLPRGRYRIEQREFPGKLVHDEVVDVVPGPEIVVEWPE